MKNKNLLWIILIIVLAIMAYLTFAEGHREDIGQLETAVYNVDNKYCVYAIKSATPDGGFFKMGDKVCIECTDTWPNAEVGQNKKCYARVTFTSASGLVVYTADSYGSPPLSICDACTDAKQYYKRP